MNRKIVIVEDDPAISDILRIILGKHGYYVEEYLEGRPIMSYTKPWPDLFLLDKQLADMDGLEICRHLKEQPQTKDIPVIILSATPNLQPLVETVGADAYIEKPFTMTALLRTIEECISDSLFKKQRH